LKNAMFFRVKLHIIPEADTLSGPNGNKEGVEYLMSSGSEGQSAGI
jgi:hypothetical protein